MLEMKAVNRKTYNLLLSHHPEALLCRISVTFVDKDGEEKNIKDVEQYNKLEDPTDEENDMLDLALGLTAMSRLGCQIIARPELDGICLAVPAATRNFAVDGYVPKPH
ncbi:hypothetical protein Pint_25402 [Pistacia integerrima]|uniref:Uncharacterized protein n=1 Tax=Pistacia integerrima TaxID=434235 RepID=A0ACC0YD20_9ROSI|nr:hypothetical protein Pint_25402 [Pistacia integerrima]